ncbi:tartrate dehydrogenase [Marinobacter sp.]|uniref:tartrate dehydrogenase n=1 Tax=Marinobacter sp. TaxID=50741 RepID=UPI001B7A7BC9|nr:tartrate dehydrogenase [Marinobacter sp.]MBQ0747309.1 tartrate dehydrogenase [Marinobacter sp.]MBQ0814421.1 tartrate dehydrogenase [Marinobacter sp.]|tara:strand:- start:5324 stop:6430 length:1107 start_codon:yes stop_codon:yes gene_type:complete
MNKGYRIAVIPGDGIGPEVVDEAVNVLELLKNIDLTFNLEFEIFEWSSEYYLRHGEIMPKDGLDTLKKYDAILFGAAGDKRVPDEVTIWQLIMPIRKKFNQYINFRPVKLLRGVPSPLADGEDIDFVIIRENAEGEYSNSGGKLYTGTERELAIQNTVITKAGTAKAARFAFEYAKNHGNKTVTSATKSNAILHSMTLWDEAVEAVSKDYPLITLKSYYIDALAAYFVSRPKDFEVVLATNLFGDILSDLGSAVVGGLGLSPSANLNPEGEFPSMFEAVHGSAPDIAGMGIANPIAQIWSAALMVEHLGREDLAKLVVEAIEDVLVKAEVRTPDLGGTSTTREVGAAICGAIKRKWSLVDAVRRSHDD